MHRRQFIKSMGAASLFMLQAPALSKALAENKTKKFVWVVLRGAMDSLHTVIPTQESRLSALRPKLSKSFKAEPLVLTEQFALHPALQNFHRLYHQKQLIPVVAVGTGYPRRSHFDGQDYLESGLPSMDHDTGWLGRALTEQTTQPNSKGLAVANSVPISMRASDKVSTWYPSNLKDADENIYEALLSLYEYDQQLMSRLQEAIDTKAVTGDMASKKSHFVELSKACGRLLKSDSSTDCAMLQLGGWDTHNNQAFRLERQLEQLDKGIDALQAELAEQWQDTVVVIATEFGRTVKENGTGGTDHGTGGAMFLLGGAVSGGKILGQWPGLAPEQLFKQRDLMPTTNTFSWIATALQQHWQMSEQEIAKVFPDCQIYPHPIVS
ncbi:DUF1501 domain-containing protein [Thalassotalea sp. HSM 43]|uniref:DUF1501 domain-containing protein n=1 Tax=Thalassotalea sp. HSM 43 TaxID=2552945 RepID=UPI001080316A|nr:DUF1501 domain-containing protein [Thalassotalea sp. HSM 43]QBY04258.1 DUF1501 domain-containing protein [Thalassotalea sp. HSM 43]